MDFTVFHLFQGCFSRTLSNRKNKKSTYEGSQPRLQFSSEASESSVKSSCVHSSRSYEGNQTRFRLCEVRLLFLCIFVEVVEDTHSIVAGQYRHSILLPLHAYHVYKDVVVHLHRSFCWRAWSYRPDARLLLHAAPRPKFKEREWELRSIVKISI